jgi:hypothetical protein
MHANVQQGHGWELGVLAATLTNVAIDPDADDPFPRALIVTPAGVRELPADWLDEAR